MMKGEVVPDGGGGRGDMLGGLSEARVAAFRAHKCEECLDSDAELGPNRRQALRRFAVFPGLARARRAEIWRVLLGFAHPHQKVQRDVVHERLWTYRVQRRAAEVSACFVYNVRRGRGLPKGECPIIASFRMYCAIFRYRASPLCGLRRPAPRELLPKLLSEDDLRCLHAMVDVLKSVFSPEAGAQNYKVADADPTEQMESDAYWALVFLTGQQTRIVVSADGSFLQTHGVRHRVLSYSKHLAEVDPWLHDLLENRLDMSHESYVEEWFRSLFALPLRNANKRDPSVLPRLWDALIACPFEMEILVAVALIRRVRHDIVLKAEEGFQSRGQGLRPATTLVRNLLADLSFITAQDISDIIKEMWEKRPTLFRRGSSINDLKENPVAFVRVEWPVIQAGSRTDTRIVRVCQFLLRARGLGTMFFVDGTFGRRTQNAVRQFRKKLQDEADKDAARGEEEGMIPRDRSNIGCGVVEPRNKGSSVPGMARRDSWGAAGGGGIGARAKPQNVVDDGDGSLSEELSGDITADLWPHLVETLEPRVHRGFAVKALQTALEMHGYSAVRVDGFFGNFTSKAVIDFQSNHAANLIEVDGIVGPLTWLHLLGVPSRVEDAREIAGRE